MAEADPKNLIVGFDVGSTTVKSVVVYEYRYMFVL